MPEGALAIDSGVLTLSSLESLVNCLQEQIKASQEAQEALNVTANSLAEYLHEFNETEAPYDLIQYSNKLGDVGRRIKGVDQTLTNVHDRLSTLQRQIAREAYKNKQKILDLAPEAVIQPPPEN